MIFLDRTTELPLWETVQTMEWTGIEKDLQKLTLLHNEMEDLDREMTALRGRLTTGTSLYLTENQNKDIEFLLLRFTKVRDTIHNILTYYRGCQSSNPEIHTRGAILGISAGPED